MHSLPPATAMSTEPTSPDHPTETIDVNANGFSEICFSNGSNGHQSPEDCDSLGDDEWPIERQLKEGRELFLMLADNKYMEAYEVFKKKATVSMSHAYAVACLMVLRAAIYFRKNDPHNNHVFEDGLEACYQAMKTIEKKRYKRSWSSLLKSVDYDAMTDEECHAELIYSEIQAIYAGLMALADPSVVDFVRAAYRVRLCFNQLNECDRILKHKTNWNCELNRRNFEAGVLLDLGLFEIAISYFPSKLIMILELAGFSSNRIAGVDKLLKVAQLQDTARYPAVAVALSGLMGFGEYFYGIGEPNVQCLQEFIDYFSVHSPNAIAVAMGRAFVNQNKGNYDEALRYYQQFTSGQKVLKSIGYGGNWQQIWIYSCMWNWDRAIDNAKYMVDKCTWSPAMFMYIYATCLLMKADEETDQDRRKTILAEAAEAMGKVNKIKMNFGGSRAFHEKLVTENAKRYLTKPESAVLPIFELLYVWNGFQVASCNERTLPMFLDKIEQKAKLYNRDESLDVHSYLTFMRGMCFAHNKRPMMALDCFLQVVGYGKKVRWAKNLAPQASFEIAQIYRRTGDYEQSKAWLKKTKQFKNYLTDSLINFRVNYVLDLIKSKENVS